VALDAIGGLSNLNQASALLEPRGTKAPRTLSEELARGIHAIGAADANAQHAKFDFIGSAIDGSGR